MRSRATSLVAIGALTLGIAGNVAVFTVVERVLLRPLNLPQSDRWLQVWGTFRSKPTWRSSYSYLNLRDMASRNSTLEALGGMTFGGVNLRVGSPERVVAAEITSDLPQAFGVAPAVGQWFPADATASGNADWAMISWGLWKRLGGDPAIVGSKILLSDKPFTVTGILPESFRLPIQGAERVQVITPLDSSTPDMKERGLNDVLAIGKMKPGVAVEQARADMIRVAAGLEREYPETNADRTAVVWPVIDEITRPVRETIWILLAAVVAVLLIACFNVASLLLARSVVRTRETGIRVALGANRGQLASQFIAEGLILAAISSFLGILVSLVVIRLFFAVAPDGIPRGEEIRIDGVVVAFSIGIAFLAGLLCSLVPLRHAQKLAPNQVLNDGARSSTAYRGRRTLRVLVAGEVALAFLLLTAALVLFAKLDALNKTTTGFDPSHVLTTQLFLSPGKYPDNAAVAREQRRILEAVAAVPGVEAVGSINMLPIRSWGNNALVYVEGLTSKPDIELESVETRVVSEDYYRAMKIPLKAGRFFTAADANATTQIGIINETTERLYWQGHSPIGTFARWGGPDSKDRVQIVGVVKDIRNAQLNMTPRPELDIYYWQRNDHRVALAVRSPLPPSALAANIANAIHRAEPEQPVFATLTMQQILDQSLTQERLVAAVVGLFSSIAVLLAMLGIYSVVAYSVAERVPEIGTRMALGAGADQVLTLILREALTMTAAGLVVGGILAFALNAILQSNLANYTSGPWWTYAVAALLVGITTVLTCLFPAYRATLVDPMVAVRNDLRSVWRQSRERLLHIEKSPAPRGEADATQTSVITELAEANRKSETLDDQLDITVEVLRRTFAARGVWLVGRSEQGDYACLSAAGCTGAGDPVSPSNIHFASNSKFLQRLKSYGSPLPLTADDLSATIRYYEQNGLAGLEEWQLIESLGVTLAVKIALRDDLIGALLLAPDNPQVDFSGHDRDMLRSLSLQLALILENSNLARRAAEEQKLRREMTLASEVQKRLFPENAPKRQSLTLAGACIPARGIGGDYYDFFDLGPHRTGIALADVAGKGIAAALIMSVVQASLRSLTTDPNLSLKEIVSRMNQLVLRSTSNSSYATFFYAVADEESQRLRFVNAGHNPPMLFRGLFEPSTAQVGLDQGQKLKPSGGVTLAKPQVCEELQAGGLVIGLFGMATYEESEVTLEPGDVLVAFTDGISEALNPAGEEFGEDRLRAAVYARPNLSAAELAEDLMVELKIWISEAPQHDDMTLLIARVG